MVNTLLEPQTLEELADAVRDAGRIEVLGSGSHVAFDVRGPEGCAGLDDWSVALGHPTVLMMHRLSGIVEHHPEDMVVVVRAGTRLTDLQNSLAERGQCIPWASPLGDIGTVGGLLALGLPNGLEARCGGWRDWCLGMTIVRPDGRVARSGSQAVKSVAGYDVHKLMIGARGTLGVIAEVILRTLPLGARPEPTWSAKETLSASDLRIQRTLATDFATLLSAARGLPQVADEGTSTLWSADAELPRFEHDWVMRAGCGSRNLEPFDAVHTGWMRRAKKLLDPEGKLNPGALEAI